MRKNRVIGCVAALAAVGIIGCNSAVQEVEAANPSVNYSIHGQTYGNQAGKSNGQIAGTTGKSKRLEAIKINVSGGGVRYRVHGQTYGWQGYKANGSQSGTTGKSKRLEAINVELTGNVAKTHDIYYRVHGQTYGWQNWVKNGKQAGTTGKSKRLEAIQVQLFEKPTYSTSITINKQTNSESKYDITVNLSGKGTAAITKVEVPVWNPVNGQNDLVWYQTKKVNNNKYTVTVDAKNHKGEVGRFYTHVYATYLDGSRTKIKETHFDYNPKPAEIAVTGLSASMNKSSFEVGETGKMSVSIEPANATNKKITYSSSDNSVATVDQSGNVKAIKQGVASIVATTYNGKSKSVTITVKNSKPTEIAVTGVEATINQSTLEIGQTGKVTSSVIPSNATNKTITYSSSNSSVATIDQSGNVKAVGAGSANLTATSNNGKTKSVALTVNQPKQTPVINVKDIYVDWGSVWNDSMLRQAFVSGTDENGNPLTFDQLTIKNGDLVNTKQSGNYTFEASYGNTSTVIWVKVKEPVYNREAVRAEMLRLVNNLRTSLGIQKLNYHPLLNRCSDIRVDELTQLYSHVRPNGESFGSLIREFDSEFYNTYSTTENIAEWNYKEMSNSELAQFYFNQWKNSAGHYRNMTRSEDTLMGFSISNDGSFAQQHFSGVR